MDAAFLNSVRHPKATELIHIGIHVVWPGRLDFTRTTETLPDCDLPEALWSFLHSAEMRYVTELRIGDEWFQSILHDLIARPNAPVLSFLRCLIVSAASHGQRTERLMERMSLFAPALLELVVNGINHPYSSDILRQFTASLVEARGWPESLRRLSLHNFDGSEEQEDATSPTVKSSVPWNVIFVNEVDPYVVARIVRNCASPVKVRVFDLHQRYTESHHISAIAGLARVEVFQFHSAITSDSRLPPLVNGLKCRHLRLVADIINMDIGCAFGSGRLFAEILKLAVYDRASAVETVRVRFSSSHDVDLFTWILTLPDNLVSNEIKSLAKLAIKCCQNRLTASVRRFVFPMALAALRANRAHRLVDSMMEPGLLSTILDFSFNAGKDDGMPRPPPVTNSSPSWALAKSCSVWMSRLIATSYGREVICPSTPLRGATKKRKIDRVD